MKILSYLLCALSIMVITHTSVNAEWSGDEPEVSVKTGVITDTRVKMGHERGEHLIYFDLDNASRWEMVNFDQASDLNWEVGDNVKIYYESGSPRHTGENLDKHNHAFVIQMAK